MKLYKNLSRFRYHRIFSKRQIELLKFGLSLNPGDMIHTCAGIDEKISEIEIEFMGYHNGWFIRDIHIKTERNSYHSLIYCCDKPGNSK
jgi:preprotein translocase subunit YajC